MTGPEPTSAWQAYGKALRNAIAAAGFNQKTFASTVAHISESHLSGIVQGHRRPPRAEADRFAELLGDHAAGLQTFYDEASARPTPKFAANGLPVELVALLKTVRQSMDDLPMQLRGRKRLSLTGLYVRQSVTAPVETTVVRVREDMDEPGLIEEIRRSSILAEPFNEVFIRHDHLVIEGAAGLGKTTLGRHLVAEFIDALMNDGSDDPVIPLLLPARVLAPLVDLTWGQALQTATTREYGAFADSELSLSHFRAGVPGARWLIVVDALDEIPGLEDRDKLLKAIERRMLEPNGERFVVTTRPLSPGETARLRGAGFYELQPFDREALEQFAQHWFNPDNTAGGALAAAEFLAQISAAGLGEILVVPLLASIAAYVHELDRSRPLPASRYALYEQYITKLVDARSAPAAAALTELASALGGADTAAWLEEHRTALTERMATAYTARETSLYDVARAFIVEHGRALPYDDQWTELLAEWLSHTGLLGRQGTRLKFLHQTFAEHLAATAAARLLPETFDPRQSQFAELIHRLLADDEDAERVLVHYLHSNSSDHALLTYLQQGTRDQREAACMLLCQGVPSTAEHLEEGIRLAEQRIAAGAWSSEQVAKLSGLVRFETVRARLSRLVTGTSIAPRTKIVLIELLRESCPEIRVIAPDLLRLWTTDKRYESDRVKAASTLAKLGPEHRDAAARVLEEVAEDPKEYDAGRLDAAEALAALGHDCRKRAAVVLLAIATSRMVDSTRHVAAVALSRLGRAHRERAAELLSEQAADVTAEVADRRDSAAALATFGGRYRARACELLADITEQTNGVQAARTLAAHAAVDPDLRQRAADVLVGLAADPVVRPFELVSLGDALVELGGEHRSQGVGLLLSVVTDAGLGQFRQQEVVDRLLSISRKHRGNVHEQLLDVLRSTVTTSPDPSVRAAAAELLAVLSPADRGLAAAELLALFSDPTRLFRSRWQNALSLANLGKEHLAQVMTVLDHMLSTTTSSCGDRVLAAGLSSVLDPARATLATALIRAIGSDAMTDIVDQQTIMSVLDDVGEAPGTELADLVEQFAADRLVAVDSRIGAIQRLLDFGGAYEDTALRIIDDALGDPTTSTWALPTLVAVLGEHIDADRLDLVRSVFTRRCATERTWSFFSFHALVQVLERADSTRHLIPGLLAALLAEPLLDDDDRIQAADAAAALGGDHSRNAAEVLWQLIVDSSAPVETRRHALATLVALSPDREPEYVAELLALADDAKSSLLEHALTHAVVASIAHDQRGAAAERLHAVITDSQIPVIQQENVVHVMSELGRNHLDGALAAWADHLDSRGLTVEHRARLASLLSGWGYHHRVRALPLLVDAVARDDVPVTAKTGFAQHLLSFRDPFRSAGLKALIALSEDRAVSAVLRMDASYALTTHAPGQATHVLQRLASDHDVDAILRVSAATRLSGMGQPARDHATSALVNILADRDVDQWARYRSAVALSALGPHARTELRELLMALTREQSEGDNTARLVALGELPRLKPGLRHDVADRMVAAAADSALSAWERLHAVHTLLRLGRQPIGLVSSALRTIASDHDVRFWERRQALEMLGELGRDNRGLATELLRDIIATERADTWERAEAVAAVQRLNDNVDHETITLLLGFVDDVRTPFAERHHAAATALTHTHDARAHARVFLLGTVANQDVESAERLSAATALWEYDGNLQALVALATDPATTALTRGEAATLLARARPGAEYVSRYFGMAADSLTALVSDEDLPADDRREGARLLGDLDTEHRPLAVAVLGELCTQHHDVLAAAVLASWHQCDRGKAAADLRAAEGSSPDRQAEMALALTKLDPVDRLHGVRRLRDLATGADSPSARLRATQNLIAVTEPGSLRATSIFVPDLLRWSP